MEFQQIFKDSGSFGIGSSAIEEVPGDIIEAYGEWLSRGYNAGMAYMANHPQIRRDPGHLLDDAKTIFSLAFPYPSHSNRLRSLPAIATYAMGADYHDVLRSRLSSLTERLRDMFGGEYRICIDSAPVFERYWAQKSGIGERADNGLIAVPGLGTRVFLAEIITTLPAETFPEFLTNPHLHLGEGIFISIGQARERFPHTWKCKHCGACRRACPASALKEDSAVDARLCLSYLTIEHRGVWDEIGESAMSTPAGCHTLYGCDLCQQSCPLNIIPGPITAAPGPEQIEIQIASDLIKKGQHSLNYLPEFQPRPDIETLTSDEILNLTPDSFSRLFKGSPIKRAKLAGLRRNALNTFNRR